MPIAPPVRPRYFALIPAAGSGTRMGAGTPKQYAPLAGKPLLQHAVQLLCEVVHHVAALKLTMHKDIEAETLLHGDNFAKHAVQQRVVLGGRDRAAKEVRPQFSDVGCLGEAADRRRRKGR